MTAATSTKEAVFFGQLPLRILHADGSIELNASLQPTYYYHLKDHLGNVRAVVSPSVTNSLEVVQTTDYYPFGMSMSKNSTTTPYNKYKYNGKLKRSGNPDRSGEEQEMPGKWLDYALPTYMLGSTKAFLNRVDRKIGVLSYAYRMGIYSNGKFLRYQYKSLVKTK